MASDAQKLIANLNAIATLIDKFPMSILNGINVKRYDSVFELLLDIMAAVGINYEEIVMHLLSEIMSVTVDNKNALIDSIQNSEIEIGQSAFLQKLEERSKVFLVNILTGLFTCSAIPIIPDRDMDTSDNNGFVVPLELIDLSGMLWVSPLTKTGKLYYSALNANATDSASLWQTFDMNAFIWNVLNNSTNINQYETNMTMWDNRRMADRYGVTVSPENNQKWISSKGSAGGELSYPSDDSGRYFPILQLNRLYDGSNGIQVRFPEQRYAAGKNGKKINSTLYKFNEDYINSIRIFDPKVILSSMVEQLFHFRFSNIATLSIEKTIIDEKIDEVITQVLEADDGVVTDCYYEFSNDEYNSMLQTAIYERYKARAYNGDANQAVSFDINDIISQLNDINSSASQVERTTKLTKLLQDVTITPGTEADSKIGITLKYNTKWWRDMIRAIALPIAKSLLTPQVMLLIEINLYELGLVNFANFANDPNEVSAFIVNKILAMLASIVKYIANMIGELIIEFIKKTLLPIISKYILLVTLEELEEYRLLLAEASACLRLSIPIFNKRRDRSAALDEVDYADIVEDEQSIPETDTNC